MTKICNGFSEFQKLNIALTKLDHRIFARENIRERYENEFDAENHAWRLRCRCCQQHPRNATEFVSANK